MNEDVDAIHPQSYCHPCNNIIYHTIKHTRDGKDYNPQKTIATWSAHSVNCSVCLSVSTHSVGGRPKKQSYTPGRPAKGSFQSAIKHIKSIAPPTICQQESVVASQSFFDCPVCLYILDRPIELQLCGRLACAGCLCRWLQVSQSPSCPFCHLKTDHLSDLENINPPSEITLRALECIEVTCSKCSKQGFLRHHKEHIDSMCGTSYFKSAPLNLSDLLNTPECVSLSPMEEKWQSSLIKRSMHSSQSLQVKTGGQVRTQINMPIIIIECIIPQSRTLVQVSSPRVSSASASQTTLRRRSGELLEVRRLVSGGEEVLQMSHEVKATRNEDREKMKTGRSWWRISRRQQGASRSSFQLQRAWGYNRSVLTIPYHKLRIMKA